MNTISRRTFIATSAASAASLAFLAGCGGQPASSSSSAASSSTETSTSTVGQTAITIGTLANEDLLPLWVAQEKDLFADNGLDVTIITFQSATELIAGIASGDVDLAMTDIMVAASIFAGGTDIQIEWVTLGVTPAQGRFGIMVGPNSEAKTLADLANVPIGVGSNTILEYVMDRLMEEAGVAKDAIKVEELQKLPVRYQAMLEGQVQAAALPASLLALGEANGCRLIADDTQGANISQSIMVARSDFASKDENRQQIERLEDVWDDAAAMINENPEDFRETLVKNTNLPEAIAETYSVSTYPLCQLPTDDMVAPVLSWMQEKGYLTQPLTYNAAMGEFSK